MQDDIHVIPRIGTTFLKASRGGRTLDHELASEGLNGLDIIEKYSLAADAVLVTSRFQDESLLRLVESKNIKLLPKILASNTQIIASGSEDWVLVDDDSLVRQMWKMSARDASIPLETFASIVSFKSQLSRFSENSRFYIDANISAKHDGLALASELKSLGFKHVTISTGEERDSLDLPESILCIGKLPPWAGVNSCVAI